MYIAFYQYIFQLPLAIGKAMDTQFVMGLDLLFLVALVNEQD